MGSPKDAQFSPMMCVADAFFPLVALSCKASMSVLGSRCALLCAAKLDCRRCVDWIVSHKHRRADAGSAGLSPSPHNRASAPAARHKDLLTVLQGLCLGGHLDQAKSLVSGEYIMGFPGPSRSLRWPTEANLQEQLVELVRDWPILDQACGVGNIEIVKWIVLNFGFQEPWQFLDPIGSALSKGHLEVAQWLAGYLNVGDELAKAKPSDLATRACESGRVDVAKWAFQRFPRIKPTEDATDYFYEALAGNSLELAAWIKESFPIEHFELSNFYFVTTKAFRWAMDTFGTAPSEEMLDMICMHIGDVDLVKWFVEENSVSPRAETLYSACVSRRPSVPLVQYITERFAVSSSDLQEAVKRCLSSNNVILANWLNEKYSILSQVHAIPGAVADLLLYLSEMSDVCNFTGVEWLVQHTPINQFDEDSILAAIDTALSLENTDLALFLIDNFTLSPQDTRRFLLTALDTTKAESLAPLQHLISKGGFTRDDIIESIHRSPTMYSSKVVKWLVATFDLTAEHIRTHNNGILAGLFDMKKEGCIQWLLERFHLGSEDALQMMAQCKYSLYRSHLSLWKLLHQSFPTLTANDIRQNGMQLVTLSPTVAQFAVKTFGISMSDLWDFFKHQHPFQAACHRTMTWLSTIDPDRVSLL
ncbi:hypothetical protein Pelo_9951 [Pelomyxa schiedti]|nr:hypothetical protein Pelo_9951 [Pelomyxa schiedti]